MFMFHDTDYTLYVIVGGSAAALFALQYVLCAKAKSRVVKRLPFAGVALLLALALFCLVTPDSGEFIDLSGVVALLLCGYAAICFAAILLARLVYWLIHRCPQ